MELKFFWIQIKDLTFASIKSRYRKTFAGFLWVVMNPLIMFGVQGLVFKSFLKLNIPNYDLFLLGGLLPWIFFSSTIQMTTPLFLGQSHLLRSFKINPMVILGSQVLDNFINFFAGFVIILLPIYLFMEKDLLSLLLLPVALIPLLIGTLAISVALSTMNVFFRDTSFVISFILNLLFYLTPIFYPKDFIPENLQWILFFNPAMYLLQPFQNLIYASGEAFLSSIVQGIGVALFFVLISILTWKRKRNAFYYKL
jgi:ABC-type polysaccharide/polyol phosphate export permease